MSTYNAMITAAITGLGARGGSTRQAIMKFIQANNADHKSINAPAFKKALASADFVKNGTRYSLSSDKKESVSAASSKARKNAPKPALTGTGLYVTINGKKYDRGMIEAANAATSSATDNLISIEDAKTIVKEALDGGKYTPTEKATMHYIRDNYNFTSGADTYVRQAVASFASKKAAKASGKKSTKKTSKKAAPKKAAAAAAAPTTYLDYAKAAISSIKDRKGASRPAIKAYVSANAPNFNAGALRRALAAGAKSGALTMTGQRFRVAQAAPLAAKKPATKKKAAGGKKKKASTKKKASKK